MEEDPQVFAYIRKEGDTEVLVCANSVKHRQRAIFE